MASTWASRVVWPPGFSTIAPKLTTRATSAAGLVARRTSASSDSAGPEKGPPAERARSAPSRARASLRTDARRLSVNELIATRAPTPIATASTMTRPRRREARDSRQARANRNLIWGVLRRTPLPWLKSQGQTPRSLRGSESRSARRPLSLAGGTAQACARTLAESSTTAPSRRRMTRCARRARSGSWVTRTSVVPSSRFSSPRRRDHVLPVRGVEVAGGLVGEEDLRPVGEGARHRHALLLAPRELRRVVVPAVAEAHPREELLARGRARPRPAARAAPGCSRVRSASG